MGDRIGVHSVLVWRPVRKVWLGRPRCRWKDDIKMDLQDLWLGMGFIESGSE